MAIKRASSSTSSGRPTPLGGTPSAVPVNISGIFRRFWDFTKKTAKKFAEQTKDPQAHESEFMKAVEKDSHGWS